MRYPRDENKEVSFRYLSLDPSTDRPVKRYPDGQKDNIDNVATAPLR